MPRKSKSKPKTKISQKVSQKVVVNIGGDGRRKRKYTRRSKPSSPPDITPMIPPTVVYQTGWDSFKPTPAPAPVSITGSYAVPSAPTASAVPSSVGVSNLPIAFQDVGVGTEGFVNILDLPTKTETLSMLGEVVPQARTPKQKYPMPAGESPYIQSPMPDMYGETSNIPAPSTAGLSAMKEAPISSRLAEVNPNFPVGEEYYSTSEMESAPVRKAKKSSGPRASTLPYIRDYFMETENRLITDEEAKRWYETPANRDIITRKYVIPASKERSKKIASGEMVGQKIAGGVKTIRMSAEDVPFGIPTQVEGQVPEAFQLISRPNI